MSSPPTPGATPVTQTAARCVSCGSRLDPAEDWCSLCHTRRGGDRPAEPAATISAVAPPEPEPEPVPEPPAAAPVAQPMPAGQQVQDAPADPDPDLDDYGEKDLSPAVRARVDLLLVELAAAEARHPRETRFGRLQSRFGLLTGSRGAMIATLVGLSLLVLIVLGLTLLGLAL